MRSVRFGIVFVFAFVLFSGTAMGCTCVHDSLSKRFRKAEAIFVGRLADREGVPDYEIQNYANDRQVLEIKRAWKGVKKDYIATDFDLSEGGGTCPMLYYFEDGKDYLVFAYGSELKVFVECSDTRALSEEFDGTTRDISRLNDFWFRTRARWWPF